MRRALILLALVGGCGCEEPTLVPVPVELPEELEAPAPGPAPELPRVRRTDLPPALPSLTVEVTAAGYRVSNRALVETWPLPERAEAAAHAPPGAVDFPVVELEVPIADPAPLVVPALSEAIARAAAADRARAGAAGGGPRVVSLRGAPDVRWERMLGALYAALGSGYAEPWLVVQAAGGERTLRLDAGSGAVNAEVRATVAEALADLTDLGAGIALPHDPNAVLDAAEDALPTLALRRGEAGLWIGRPGAPTLGADCRTAADGDGPTLAGPTLDAAAVGACLDATGPFSLALVEGDPDLAYGSLLPVLEALAGRGPIGIAMGHAPGSERSE